MQFVNAGTVGGFYARCATCHEDIGPFQTPAPVPPEYRCGRCGRLARQRAAAAAMATLADPLRLRVTLGDETAAVDGLYGRLTLSADGRLWVHEVSRRLFRRLQAIPGVDLDEAALELPGLLEAAVHPEAFAPVARLIRARRKPGLTSGMAREVGSRTAFGGTSRWVWPPHGGV
jgi:hypothetical protein